MKDQLPIPTEAEEQIVLVEWLERQGLRLTSVPNSTWTSSWKQKTMNRRTGLRAGFPDLIVLIAPHQAKDGVGRLLALELKRRKGGTVSPQQKEWIAALNGLRSPSIDSVVAHGAEEAIEYISAYLKRVDNSPF